MAAMKNQKALLKKLKKQVRTLQRREAQSRNKLKTALKKIRKLGRSYKSKFVAKVRAMKGKISEAQASTYAKVAADVERQLKKGIEAKGKSIRSALAKFEKKYISKMTKGLAKKGKKAGKSKVRKGKKASSVSMKKIKRVKRRSVRRSRSRSRRR